MAELISESDPRAAERVSEILLNEGLVVVPTDTVYGLAVLPSSASAVAAVFEVKQRPEGMHLAVLVAGPEQLPAVSADDRRSVRRIAEHLWPGALTLVLPEATQLVSRLGDGDGTIGVRCPDHQLIRSIASMVGPIATTSANLHGRPTPTTALQILDQIPQVDLVVDGGEPAGGAASTVVSLTGAEPEILRAGPVPLDDIIEHWDE